MRRRQKKGIERRKMDEKEGLKRRKSVRRREEENDRGRKKE